MHVHTHTVFKTGRITKHFLNGYLQEEVEGKKKSLDFSENGSEYHSIIQYIFLKSLFLWPHTSQQTPQLGEGHHQPKALPWTFT